MVGADSDAARVFFRDDWWCLRPPVVKIDPLVLPGSEVNSKQGLTVELVFVRETTESPATQKTMFTFSLSGSGQSTPFLTLSQSNRLFIF